MATSALVFAGIIATGASASADVPVADAQSALDSATASQVAQAHDHNVTVDGETTPTTLVTANADGSFTMKQDSVPVRTQQAGSWVPIQTDLVPTDGSWLAPKATDTHVRFSRGGSDTFAQIQTETGSWVSESWPTGNSLPTPTLDGATATYSDVLPDVDLQLTATPAGMDEVLVVNTPEAAANPELQHVELQLHGASLSISSTESTATASDGSTLSSSKPTWWDSANGGTANGPGGAGSPQPLEHTATNSTVTLDVATATDTSPTYPVFVDPDWSSGQNAYWFDDLAYPSQSYLNGQYSAGYQSVGWAVENGTTFMSRAFWQFNLGALSGKHITSAHFNAVATYSCGEGTVEAWRYGVVGAGQNWSYDQANQGQWRDHISDAEIPGVSGCATAGKAVGWDVTRGADATAGGTFQIGLRSPVENTWSRKHFNQGASLTVSYNTIPNTPSVPTITTPTRACGTSDANTAWVNNHLQVITLQVNASDPDGGNVSTVFHIMHSNDPNTYVWGDSTDTMAPGPQSITIPVNKLADGKYMFRAKSKDATDYGAWTPWCYFSTDSTIPNPPKVTGLPTTATVGTAINATVSAGSSDAGTKDSDLRGFQYWVSDGDSHAAVQPHSQAVSTSTGYHTCSFRDGIVTYVCADANGAAKITFTPTDSTSRLWVKAIDKAGNVSTKAASPTGDGDGWTFNADNDPRVGTGSATTGHVWSGLTAGSVTGDGTSTSPTVIADESTSQGTGTAAPKSLTLDDTTVAAALTYDQIPDGVDIPAGTIGMHEPDLLRVSRYNGAKGHTSISTGNTFEVALGEVLVTPSGTAPPANMLTITSCVGSYGDAQVTGSCPSGTTSSALLGYAWKAASDVPAEYGGAKAIYTCWDGKTYFNSLHSDCEGQTNKWSLGYFARTADPNQTATAPVDTTKSYTVSAWLKPSAAARGRYATAASIDGAQSSAFYLQWAGDDYRFCVKSQPDAASSTCVSPNRTSGLVNGWTFVSGIWDADNQQIRILINGSAAGEGTAYHALGSGEKAATGALRLGSAISSGGPSDAWQGDLASPSITQGVATSTQLRLLKSQGTYVY